MTMHRSKQSMVNRKAALRRAVVPMMAEMLEQRRLLSGSVSGSVYYDLDGNGTQNPNEQFAEYFQVYVDMDNNGAPSAGDIVTYTNAAGGWAFNGLAAGTYHIRVEPGDYRYVSAPGPEVFTVNVTDGSHTTAGSFGVARYGSISVDVFDDANNNTRRDNGEQRVVGWTVFLDTNGNGQLDENERSITSTDRGNGFDRVRLGEYRVVLVNPNGYEITTREGISLTTQVTDQRSGGADFGVNISNAGSASISGRTYSDVNGNGQYDAGVDTGMGIGIVYLDLNNNGRRDTTEPARGTDPEAGWSFASLPAGQYTIRFETRAGYEIVAPSAQQVTITLADGQHYAMDTSVAWEAPPAPLREATVSGRLFHDVNSNGIQDEGEPGLVGVKLLLTDFHWVNPALPGDEGITYTDANGDYIFSSLGVGNYRVRLHDGVPEGWYARSGYSDTFYVGYGNEQIDHNPIGFAIPAEKMNGAISGRVADINHNAIVGAIVYIDVNRDGIKNDDEPSALTDNGGNYRFESLIAGGYVIRLHDDNGQYVMYTPANGLEVAVNGSGESRENDLIVMSSNIAPTTPEPQPAVIEHVLNDFNGDGKPDLYFHDTTAGNITLWYMDGKQRTGVSLLMPLNEHHVVGATGDFNGDGKTDLVIHNNMTGESHIVLLNGIAVAGTAVLPTTNPAWRMHGAGDFNGDGNTDIVFRNVLTGAATVWFMDGTSLRTNTPYGALPWVASNDWQITAVNDFDGDGDPDILWAHRTSNRNSLWLMDQLTVPTNGFRGVPAPITAGWHLSATSDFNGDGRADLLWRNNGKYSIWFLENIQNQPLSVAFDNLLLT